MQRISIRSSCAMLSTLNAIRIAEEFGEGCAITYGGL
jgi:hypothetical protein